MALQRLLITKTDGTEIIVTPTLADTLNFERTLKNNPAWGSLQDNQLKAGPFRAWSAGKREGTVTETWEDFANVCANVDVAPEPAPAGDESLEVPGLGLDGRTIQPTI